MTIQSRISFLLGWKSGNDVNADKTPGEWENSLKFPALYFLELWEREGRELYFSPFKDWDKRYFYTFKII